MEVLVTGVGVPAVGTPVEVGSMVTIGRGEAVKVGNGSSVAAGLVGIVPSGTIPVGLGLTLVLPGSVVMVGS